MALLSLIDSDLENHAFEISSKETVVGRVKCGITINDRSISRRHAVIVFRNSHYEIEDLHSRNGTFINGKRVSRSILSEGDHIRLGKKLFLFQDNPSSDRIKTSFLTSPGNCLPLELEPNDDSRTARRIRQAVDAVFRTLTKAENVSAHLFKKNGKAIYCFYSKYRRHLKSNAENDSMFSKSILNYASKEGKTVLAEDAQHDARFNCTDSIARWKIRSVVCTPLLARNRLAGIIQASTTRPNHKFTPAEMELMDFIGGSVSVAIENLLLNDTIRKQEALLQKALKQMETAQNSLMHNDKLALIGKLSSGILHDVKNPLGAMIGYIGLVREMIKNLQAEIRNNADIADNLRLLEEGANHCYELINQILNFARQVPEPTMFIDLNKILATTTEFLSYEFNKNHVKVQSHFGADLPMIKANGNQLKQVFINIILNAIQAMEGRERKTLELSTSHDPHQGNVMVRIEDDGVGMTEAVQQKIFQPFFSTKKAGMGAGGSGLGLAVCQEIIHLHGGAIFVDSAPDKGAIFTIKLPSG